MDALFPKTILAANSKRVSERLKNKLSEFRNREWNFISVAADQELNTPMRELEQLNKIRRRAAGEPDPHRHTFGEEFEDKLVQARRVTFATTTSDRGGRGRGGKGRRVPGESSDEESLSSSSSSSSDSYSNSSTNSSTNISTKGAQVSKVHDAHQHKIARSLMQWETLLSALHLHIHLPLDEHQAELGGPSNSNIQTTNNITLGTGSHLAGGVNVAPVVVTHPAPVVADGILTTPGQQVEPAPATTTSSSISPPLQHSLGKGKGASMHLLESTKASKLPSACMGVALAETSDWAAGVGRGSAKGSKGKGRGRGKNSTPGRGRGSQATWDSSDDEREQHAAAAAGAPAPKAPAPAPTPAATPAASKRKVKEAWRPVWSEDCGPQITLIPLHIGMAVQAKYYAKPKVAPHGCSSFANKWHPGVIASISPDAAPPVVKVHYDDDAREEAVLYSSLKAWYAEPAPGAPAAAPPAVATPATAISTSSSSVATTVEESMEMAV